jgi:hypothetical protein
MTAAHFGAADAFQRFSYRETVELSRIFNVTPRQIQRWAAEHDHQNGPLDFLEMAQAHILRVTGDPGRAKAPALYLLSRFDAPAEEKPHEILMTLGRASKDFAEMASTVIEGHRDGRFTRAELQATMESLDELDAQLHALRKAAEAERSRSRFGSGERP